MLPTMSKIKLVANRSHGDGQVRDSQRHDDRVVCNWPVGFELKSCEGSKMCLSFNDLLVGMLP